MTKTKKPKLAKIIPLRPEKKQAKRPKLKATKKNRRMIRMTKVWQAQSDLAGMSPDEHIVMLFSAIEMMIVEGYATREQIAQMCLAIINVDSTDDAS